MYFSHYCVSLYVLDSAIHLENILMPRFSFIPQQRFFIVHWFDSDRSVVNVQRKFRAKFGKNRQSPTEEFTRTRLRMAG